MHLYIYLCAFIYIYDILINEMLQTKCFIKIWGGGRDESQFQGTRKFFKINII